MRRVAVDGGNRLIANDKAANVAPWFLDVFLDVKDRVLVSTQRVFVLQKRLSRVPVAYILQ